MDLPSTSPVLLLKVVDEPIHIPIWIGSSEAAAIAQMVDGVASARPLTHDLVLDVAAASGRSLTAVEVISLVDDVYFAQLVFDDGGRVDARTSDAVALAVRADIPIRVAESVIDEVGEDISLDTEDELAAFREFLDHVSAEDFDEEGNAST